MFCMPPRLLTGGFLFTNMWSASEFRHMLQGGFFAWTMIVINKFLQTKVLFASSVLFAFLNTIGAVILDEMIRG